MMKSLWAQSRTCILGLIIQAYNDGFHYLSLPILVKSQKTDVPPLNGNTHLLGRGFCGKHWGQEP